MSIEVPIDQLFADLDRWGAGFLATVDQEGRARFVSLRPTEAEVGGERVLHFANVGRTACSNIVARPNVSIVFPSHAASDGFSLIVDGVASVPHISAGVSAESARQPVIDVRPTWAVLHRPAP